MRQADAIDPRAIYKGFASVTWAAGFGFLAWGPVWLGSDLPNQPWGKAALIRVAGALVIADGCFAAALSTIADLRTHRRAVLWFAVAHGFLLVILLSQRAAIWGEGLVDMAIAAIFTAGYIFSYLWLTASGERVRSLKLTTLFGKSEGGLEQLRSEYEEQIRKAASQEERNRLARDLHDSIKQQIFAIQTSAATAQARFENDPAGARDALDRVRDSAREAMAEMEAMLDLAFCVHPVIGRQVDFNCGPRLSRVLD